MDTITAVRSSIIHWQLEQLVFLLDPEKQGLNSYDYIWKRPPWHGKKNYFYLCQGLMEGCVILCIVYPTLETFFLVFPPPNVIVHALCSCPGDAKRWSNDRRNFRPFFTFFFTTLKAPHCLVILVICFCFFSFCLFVVLV